MARADYQAQMERHAGEWDVLPRGLVIPSLPHGSDWRRGRCRGIAVLGDDVLEGNRWPAVSGAVLAELGRRCAELGALTVADPSRTPLAREIAVRFRKAIPVGDPRRRPHVADGASVLYWQAEIVGDDGKTVVAVSMTRRPSESDAPVEAVRCEVRFEMTRAENDVDAGLIELWMSDYLLALPRRLALPAYHLGWTGEEIRGACRELPGSLVGVAEQALGDAGKIIRGEGTPSDQDEAMLLADMIYRWLEPIDDGLVEYVARPGKRRADERGRDWVDASATLTLNGKPVGEASGTVVLRKHAKRS